MQPTRHSRRRQGERGFALLVVFLIAAGIMISLYLEIPRVAFESQRNREDILIERGEQYSRAVEVFYRKNKRYPGKLEDLENTNNLRFLRRRYKDPMTGKDEWRLVRMGANGQLADSLVEKPGQQAGANGQPGQPGQPGQAAGAGIATGTTPVVDPNAPPDPDAVNAAALRAARDGRAVGRPQFGPGTPGYDPNNPNAQLQAQQQFQQQQQFQPPVDANGNPIPDPNNPNAFAQPGQPGFNPQQQQQFPNFPGQPIAVQGPAGINPQGVQPTFPGQTVTYQNGMSPGAQLQGQLGMQNGQNPVPSGFGQNPALNAINNQLRNQNGFQQQPNQASLIPPGAVRLADGTYKMPDGTMYNPDGTIKYQDPNAPKTPTPGQPGAPGAPGAPGQSGFGQSGFGQSGFGQQPGQTATAGTGFGSAIQTSPQTGSSFGGAGIAGVASTQAGVGIKRYNDRSKYKEWEFIFDYRKPKTKPTTGVTGIQTSGTGSVLGKPLSNSQ